MVTCRCLWCKEAFQARKADVERGWGKFCSKKCKAINQSSPGGCGRVKQAGQRQQKLVKSPVVAKAAPKDDLPRDHSFSDYDLMCAAEDAQETPAATPRQVTTTRHAYR